MRTSSDPIYRMDAWVRWLLSPLVCVVLWAMAAQFVPPMGLARVALAVSLAGAGLILLLLTTCWIYLRVGPEQVVVRNIFRTYEFDRSDVEWASAGVWGLYIRLRDGQHLRSVAVTKPMVADLLPIRTRGDRIAEDLMVGSRDLGDS